MIKYLFLIMFCFVLVSTGAQNKAGKKFFEELTYPEQSKGKITVVQEDGIQDLIGIHLDMNKRNPGIEGFRIQLYLGSNNNAKKEATDVKAKVLSLFPDEKIYVMYEAPFWRVQVGDFRSKNESMGLYKKLRKEFPSCYPVPVDDIKMSSLSK